MTLYKPCNRDYRLTVLNVSMSLHIDSYCCIPRLEISNFAFYWLLTLLMPSFFTEVFCGEQVF